MRPFISMCAFAALANCAKADIDFAQEQLDFDGNLKGIVVHNPTAVIGQDEKQVKTPWMIVRPDGESGFANDFTTNAIAVVSEDGTNYYAHVEDENGDRTKVIHFTVNESGIPSKHGDLIDLLNTEETTIEDMKDKKLVGIAGGCLYFYPISQYGKALIYHTESGSAYVDAYSSNGTSQKYLASCQYPGLFYFLSNIQDTDSNGNVTTNTHFKLGMGGFSETYSTFSALPEDRNKMIVCADVYTGDSEGNIYKGESIVAKLPGAISGLSFNGQEVFATTPATNAFYNVTLGKYNAVEAAYSPYPKSMIPKTNDGLIRVIDNRRNGGKFLCVTTKGIIAVDD